MIETTKIENSKKDLFLKLEKLKKKKKKLVKQDFSIVIYYNNDKKSYYTNFSPNPLKN